MMQIGYSRHNMTPLYPVPLAGFGNSSTRMSQGWVVPICTTCIAFTDDAGSTVLMFTTDMCVTEAAWTAQIRKKIFDATGVPENHIMIGSTHSHSAPDIGNTAEPTIADFHELYDEKMLCAAIDALADRAPAKAEIGRTVTGPLNHVRHYRNHDGSYAGDNYGTMTVESVADHASQADRGMQIIRITRQGKKDIVLVNWQAHPTITGTAAREKGRLLRPFLSSDFIGTCRVYLEKELDCHFAYFQGACGNLNSRTFMTDREYVTDNVHDYGKELGQFVLEGLKNMEPVNTDFVKVKRLDFAGPMDKSDNHRIEEARMIAKLWRETNDVKLVREVAAPYDIHSPYHANAIVARYNGPDTITIELNAIAIGDIGFVTAPYEMFDVNGKFIKDNTPQKMTFVMECANAHMSYMASEIAFDYGCYEADIRRYPKGTAERLAQTFVDMLTDLTAQ